MSRLVPTREEDCVVGVAERVDPAVGRRRDGDDGFAERGYGGNSLPSTSSYRRGTNVQTSWAMNFR
jgi:hypothetical protein